jgi:hypothetical protein
MEEKVISACKSVISSLINNNDSFTVADVICINRNYGCLVAHNEVKEYVYKAMKDKIDNGLGYTQYFEDISQDKQIVYYRPNEEI